MCFLSGKYFIRNINSLAKKSEIKSIKRILYKKTNIGRKLTKLIFIWPVGFAQGGLLNIANATKFLV